ncbi:OsmC family peroxiredoxin [Putridiphycobacter roseus]|uniref:OsmC family peroxiredoxin n=1 Tax=Putridiphycobacter roseus TaxID=2219161 RepID=A0A2W1NS76_9FLAO|nr:OsmC family protein [Putridiphycobacter roseus]PZE18502.1 OsmC family peroxiredoxin [Putridiphycobacter roseus]
MNHKTITNWSGDMMFEATVPGGKIKFDADVEVGGQDGGVRPKPTMLSALAGCTGMDVVSLLKKMRAEVSAFRVEVDGNLTEEHPKFYDKVTVRYFFKGEDLKKDKIEKAVDLSVNRYCGVFEMFRSFAKVTHEIVYE